MATDYTEKEREFLADLKADTGRDLAEWMAAISARGFRDKNEVIDWLRSQGFMFWKASWLERVHHNGGKPIYADPVTARANAEIARNLLEVEAHRAKSGSAAAPAPPPSPPALTAPPPPPRREPTPPQGAQAPHMPDGDVLEVLAKAKGYRPLAELLLRTIRTACPAARVEVRGALLVISDGDGFAVVVPTAREIKLGLALGDRAAEPTLAKARIAGAPDRITHTISLTDARQITPELQALIREAHGLAR
jgi:hypothetical protein